MQIHDGEYTRLLRGGEVGALASRPSAMHDNAPVRQTMLDRMSCLDKVRNEEELQRLFLTFAIASKCGMMRGTVVANKFFHDRPAGVSVLEWSVGMVPDGVEFNNGELTSLKPFYDDVPSDQILDVVEKGIDLLCVTWQYLVDHLGMSTRAASAFLLFTRPASNHVIIDECMLGWFVNNCSTQETFSSLFVESLEFTSDQYIELENSILRAFRVNFRGSTAIECHMLIYMSEGGVLHEYTG